MILNSWQKTNRMEKRTRVVARLISLSWMFFLAAGASWAEALGCRGCCSSGWLRPTGTASEWMLVVEFRSGHFGICSFLICLIFHSCKPLRLIEQGFPQWSGKLYCK